MAYAHTKCVNFFTLVVKIEGERKRMRENVGERLFLFYFFKSEMINFHVG